MLKKLLTLALIFCLASAVAAKNLSVYDANTKTVRLEIGDANNRVVIGNSDAKEDFQAYVKMEFWGEDYISLCEEGVKGTPTLKNDIIELDLGKRKLQWLKDGTSNLKWIEILNEKPLSNKWSLKIADEGQFKYCYQTPLAELSARIPGSRIEYFAEGNEAKIRLVYPTGSPIICDERPLNINGSIAIFHKTKRDHIIGQKDYLCGKVLHIPRPKAVDKDGKWAWCDIQVKDSVYTRTAPWPFLNTAVYPVTINDEFGYSSTGGSKGTSSASYFYANNKGSPASSGSATSMSMYGDVTADPVNVTMGIWNDNAGEPGTLLRDTAEFAMTVTDGWWPANLDTPVGISSESTYWLGKNSEATIRWMYDTDSEDTYHEQIAYVAGTLDDFGTPVESSTNRLYYIYVTYTPSAEEGGQVIITNSSMGYGFGGFGLILVMAIIRKLRNRKRGN